VDSHVRAVADGPALEWSDTDRGDARVSVSLEHFGESADYQKLYMRSIASAGRKA
jgi:hypothetical protein